MKNKKICAVITLLCFLLTLMPVAAFAADESTVVNSGSCGDNATWELTSDGVLTISGSGEMYDYVQSSAPWFGNSNIITKVVIEDGITNIGNYAFCDFYFLETIAISNSVTSIGEAAFGGCRKLEAIVIPDGITRISNRTFSGCESLTSITVPDGVTSIGNTAFSGCNGLISIAIPDSVTNIGGSAFVACSSLTSITIPHNVTSIGEAAFADCISLISITIPDSVTSIGHSAFQGCSSLTSIEMSNSVTSIEEDTFGGCSSLSSITIPDSVTGIGNYAFFNCRNLRKVVIPDSVTFIGSYVFSNCNSLIEIEISNRLDYIGTYAFNNCSNLTKITIPDSVETIGSYAFNNCSSLIAIEMSDSVKNIGNYAFSNCSSLITIGMPNSINHIGNYTFRGCSSLTEITIPDSIEKISFGVFYHCNNLAAVTIPESITKIEGYSFNGCSSLAEIRIPNGVMEIGESAFDYCSNLKDVYYDGTKVEWDAITIDSRNDYLFNATIHCIDSTENAPSANTSTFSINTTEVQTNENFDITLNLLDENGLATNCTTTLYVWATKVGSTIPTSALSVAGAEDMGNGVYILKNKSHAEKISVSLSRAGAYTMHVSLDGVELRGVNTKVEVEVVRPALASGLKVMVGDKILSANESYLLTENAYTDGAEFEKIYVTKNDKTGVEVTAYLLDEEGYVLKGKNLNLDSNSANIVIDKITVTTNHRGEADFKITAKQAGEYKLYVSWDENTVAIPVTVTAPSSGSSSGGSSGGGGGSSNPNSSNISNITVTSPDKEIKVNQSTVGNNIVKDATEAVKENTAVEVIGGKNCAVSISAKESGKTNVSSFDEPLTVSVPVNANALKDVKDTSKLTLAQVSKDEKGNTVLTYVGGNYDKQTGKFTAYVDEPGDYILVEDSNIKKVELQIGKQASAVNGTNIMNDVAPIIYNNRTMVPLRFIAETLGAQVDWNGETSTVTLTVDGVTMEMTIDKTIDGFDVAPIIYEGRTMVPIRYIAEKLGANVIYVPETQEIVVVK